MSQHFPEFRKAVMSPRHDHHFDEELHHGCFNQDFYSYFGRQSLYPKPIVQRLTKVPNHLYKSNIEQLQLQT